MPFENAKASGLDVKPESVLFTVSMPLLVNTKHVRPGDEVVFFRPAPQATAARSFGAFFPKGTAKKPLDVDAYTQIRKRLKTGGNSNAKP